MHLNRRSFLAGTVAAGAALAGASLPPAASAQSVGPSNGTSPARVPLTREEHRVVVVGSGFGGGVSALRLTHAGVPVLMLERGREWKSGPNQDTFPLASSPDKRLLWHGATERIAGQRVEVEPYVGLIDAFAGENMTALAPAGLGGGSLIYQGMSLQPAEHVFNEHLPEQLDWQMMNRDHYPRVARMLNLAVAPDELIESPTYLPSRVFADNARRAGLPVSKIPMPIDWNYALAELRGEMKPAYTNGDGAMGVNNGGKFSVDATYIEAARRTGLLQVETHHEVTDVERAPDGRWVVRVNRTDDTGKTLEQKVITTPTLIMAAGSIHTTRLLVRARDRGDVSDLPEAIGQGWGTNADRIYGWHNPEVPFGAVQGGPVVYGSLNWDSAESAHTVIQASTPPLGVDLRTTMMVGFGASRDRGHFSYDSSRDDATLHWPANGDSDLQWGHIHPTATALAGPGGQLIDTNAVFNSTWHSLGGACMGAACDLEGRVDGQRGLYVLDGALIPGTTAACNPSMTIAAVAERAMDSIVRNDVGAII